MHEGKWNHMRFLKNLVSGFALGASNMFPGMSAGTMAVVIGIFDDLVGALSGLFKRFKQSFLFLLPVALGMAAGIISFAAFFDWALERFPVQCYAVFGGLVIGSLPLIWKYAAKSRDISKEKGGMSASCVIAFTVCLSAIVVMSLLNPAENAAVVSFDLGYALYMVAAVAVAAAAMIVPGLSGSYIMLLFGVYATIIAAISEMVDFGRYLLGGPSPTGMYLLIYIIPTALGCIIGFIGGAKLIRTLLDKWPKSSYFGILGLMCGSLFGIGKYAFSALPSDGSVLVLISTSAVALALGIGVTLLLSKRVK